MERAAAGDPVTLTAPTVMEVAAGLQSAAANDRRFSGSLDWWVRTVHSELVEVVGLDRYAAVVAGRLRARRPLPPSPRRKGLSKPDARAGWVLDLQIAACAWTAGRDVTTDNRDDFLVISDEIAALYPQASRLGVLAPPAPADA